MVSNMRLISVKCVLLAANTMSSFNTSVGMCFITSSRGSSFTSLLVTAITSLGNNGDSDVWAGTVGDVDVGEVDANDVDAWVGNVGNVEIDVWDGNDVGVWVDTGTGTDGFGLVFLGLWWTAGVAVFCFLLLDVAAESDKMMSSHSFRFCVWMFWL